jgi:hypothetical protein
VALAFVACENDYNSLDSDIKGIQDFETNSDRFAVVAYNKRVGPVQTNNLPSNFIGIYTDPIYGQTTNNVITQVVPNSIYYNPDFGTDPEFKSAYLTIPYYATQTVAGDNPEYELDSLFGDGPVKLSIYRSNYFLRDYDPNTDAADPQLYYSNNDEFGMASNLDELLYYDEAFIPSPSEQIVYEEDDEGQLEEITTLPPCLYLPLLNPGGDFWKTLLFDKQGMTELSNANNFKDYFRGLYFKVEPVDGVDGNAVMLNFDSSAANLTIYYNNQVDVLDDEGNVIGTETARNNKFIMNFRANRASTITVDPATNTLLNNASNNADVVNGDQTLYLKGGEGSIAVVNLFEDPAVLDEFNLLYKNSDGTPSRLINEANLIFYVDQQETASLNEDQQPYRVILYDLKNNIPVVDYFYDLTTNTTDPIDSKLNYSSKLEFDANGNGVKYKLRITEYLNNILLKDSTNFQLGLYLTTNINEISNSYILNNGDPEGIPVGTVLSQKGTILHGSNINVPEEKRLELEVYYTQPDN